MIVEHPAREGKNLRRHVDDRAVAQHRAGHADAVHIGAVRRAEVMQLVVAVLVQNLAVMAGDAVIDELDVAVVAAPDEYAALAADVCLAQAGVGGLLLFRGHAIALHAGDLLDAKGDLLRVRVAVGVQADDVAALQNTRLAGLKIAVVVPGAVVAAAVGDAPLTVRKADGELVVADVVAAQHVLALGAAPKAVAARGQRDALLIAQLGDQNYDLARHGAPPYQWNSAPQNGTNFIAAPPMRSVSPPVSGWGVSTASPHR